MQILHLLFKHTEQLLSLFNEVVNHKVRGLLFECEFDFFFDFSELHFLALELVEVAHDSVLVVIVD